MSRVDQWEHRLDRYLVETRDEVFEWGRADCILWAAGAVEAITGRDYGEHVRGRYTTREEGIALVRDMGHPSVPHLLGSMFEPCALLEAVPGDLVYLPGDTVGILQGRFAYAKALRGWALVSPDEAKGAWHV